MTERMKERKKERKRKKGFTFAWMTTNRMVKESSSFWDETNLTFWERTDERTDSNSIAKRKKNFFFDFFTFFCPQLQCWDFKSLNGKKYFNKKVIRVIKDLILVSRQKGYFRNSFHFIKLNYFREQNVLIWVTVIHHLKRVNFTWL